MMKAEKPPAGVGQTLVHKPATRPMHKQEDTLVTYAPPVDLLQHPGTDLTGRAPYLANVVRCQAGARLQRKHSAVMWGSLGGLAGLLIGAPTGPFCPIFAAGGAAVGAAAGAAAPMEAVASFRQVRKHLFFKSGIVPSENESAVLVAALKKAKILNKGRNRTLLNLKDLDAVLAQQAYLNSKQRNQVRECLSFIAQEAVHFDALIRESVELKRQIAHQSHGRRRGPTASCLQTLYARQAQVHALLQLQPKGAITNIVRAQTEANAYPKAITGPRPMHVPESV